MKPRQEIIKELLERGIDGDKTCVDLPNGKKYDVFVYINLHKEKSKWGGEIKWKKEH